MVERERTGEAQTCLYFDSGLGGTGGFQAQVLARLGIGNFKIADPDKFELINMNRQAGATVENLDKYKADVARDMILSINPDAKVESLREPVNDSNREALMQGCDAVIDGIDFFAFDDKMKLFQSGIEMEVPVITSAPIGFGSTLIIFTKGSMSPYQYFDIDKNTSDEEKAFRLAFGLSPSPLCFSYLNKDTLDAKGGRASSVCPGPMLAAAFSGTEVVIVVTGKSKINIAPRVYQVDLFTQKVSKKNYFLGMSSPWMRLKRTVVKKMMGK